MTQPTSRLKLAFWLAVAITSQLTLALYGMLSRYVMVSGVHSPRGADTHTPGG